MRCTMLKEHYAWEPVCFDALDLLRLMEKAVMAEVVVRREKETHWIGVACEYDRKRQLFDAQKFYIDSQEFDSIEAFTAQAVLDGELFSTMSEPLVVIDTLEGDPAGYLRLPETFKNEGY